VGEFGAARDSHDAPWSEPPVPKRGMSPVVASLIATLALAAVVLAVVGVAAVLSDDHPSKQQSGFRPIGRAVPGDPTPTTSSFSVDEQRSAQLDAVAIGLQASDLPASYERFDEVVPDARVTPEPLCTPVSSRDPIAFVRSPEYDTYHDDGMNENVASFVAVMRNPADASAALSDVATKEFAGKCFRPSIDEDEQHFVDDTNTDLDCWSLTGSSVTTIPASELPPGMIGLRYRATTHCSLDNSDSYLYSDELAGTFGSVYFELDTHSVADEPDLSAEVAQIQQIAERAKARASAAS